MKERKKWKKKVLDFYILIKLLEDFIAFKFPNKLRKYKIH